MSAPSVVLFQFIGETIDNAVAAFVSPAASNLIDTLGPVALAGTTLYLILMGYMTLGGYLTSPLSAVVKQAAKVALISAFAFNSVNYMSWVVDTVDGLQVGLSNAMTPGAGSVTSIYQTLDNSLDRAFNLVGECLSNANDAGMNVGSALSWMFCALAIGLGSLIFMLIGGAIVITAKLSLAVLFGIGPFFIMCLMWPVTARFFDSWFSQVMNYTLTIVIVAIFISFSGAAFDRFIAGADVSADGQNSPAFAALQILGLTGLLSFILFQVGGLASGLAGGVSMAAMTLRQMASPATSAARSISTGAASAQDIVNPLSTRLDPKTGLQTTSRRLEHLAMGRSVVAPNPAYRRAVMDQIKSSWGAKNSVSDKS